MNAEIPWGEGEAKKTISSVAEIPSVALYLKRIGAKPRSFKTAVVEEQTGRYASEISRISFSISGAITVADEAYAPTEAEAAAIAADIGNYSFPQHMPLAALTALPPELAAASAKSLFEFRDESGRIVMLQQRIETEKGKAYIPWTYWSDGIWRRMEPDGDLPFWGLEQLNEHAVVFIHEGAKAARYVLDQINGVLPVTNPWLEEMRYAAHLGWIGGALSAHRTDWAVLRRKGIKRATIVSDNDPEGRSVVPFISERLHCPTFHLQFDGTFPEGFDLGDEFPVRHYDVLEGQRTYIGPMFIECLHPATWATNTRLIPQERGRPRVVHELRPTFAQQWMWVESVDLFLSKDFPTIQLKREIFNNSIRPFSHVANTAGLLAGSFTGRNVNLTYRPDNIERVITDEGQSSVNLFRPSNIRPTKGDVTPFLELLEYMFPIPKELAHVKRWIAAILAHPEIKMAHGLMILSEMQGIGKTTLGNILAEGVGRHNVSFPGEQMIVNQNFNGWLANKRLIVVNEIYSGHSWKAYHSLKSYLTDEHLEVNIKHMATYTIPNWTHYYVCSNSLNALKVEDQDRRWFVPQVTEVPWSHAKFQTLRRWIAAGGVPKIMYWAAQQTEYVRKGEIAPMTISKERLIEDSRSDEETKVLHLADIIMAQSQPVTMAIAHIKDWCKGSNGKVYETERRLGGVMRKRGLYVNDDTISYKGKKLRFVSNRPDIVEDAPDREARIAASFMSPAMLFSEEF